MSQAAAVARRQIGELRIPRLPDWELDEGSWPVRVLWPNQSNDARPERKCFYLRLGKGPTQRQISTVRVGMGENVLHVLFCSKALFRGPRWRAICQRINEFCLKSGCFQLFEPDDKWEEDFCLAEDLRRWPGSVPDQQRMCRIWRANKPETTYGQRLEFFRQLAGFIVDELSPVVEWRDYNE